MSSNPIAGKRIAIANRGEIAVRIAATCRRMGSIPIALLGEPDLTGYAARQIGLVEPIGEAGSELDIVRVINAATRVRADFLHPGYGFLSERADLAEACELANLRFVGPSAATLRLCGDKLETRNAAERAEAPVLLASPPLNDDPASWTDAAQAIGFPLLVKPAGAGGGRGLRHVAKESELIDAVDASRRESSSSGAGTLVYLERELVEPRHIEVQLAADRQTTLVVGDRDCSIQRRHQKVIEEAPAPGIDQQTRAALHRHALRIAQETNLVGIATCEFLLGGDGEIAFLEVNPRIQVEHPVTELVSGIDLVEWQLLIASGGRLPLTVTPEPRGHAIEARVYAEDPQHEFFPTTGRLESVSWPARPNIRVDAGYGAGDLVTGAYDPMLAKVIAFGADRESAVAELHAGVCETIVAGLPTNLPWLLNLLEYGDIREARANTGTAAQVATTMPDRSLAPAAAAAHLISASDSRQSDAWTVIGPWRMFGVASITFHGDEWESQVAARRTTTGWEASLDSSPDPVRWWRDAAGIWTIASADVVRKFAVIDRDGEFLVYGGGGYWQMRTGSRPVQATARKQRSGDCHVKAPLPATVQAIHVTIGDTVDQAQPLLTLYAMKMELVCAAPSAGTVEEIACAVGDLVDADQLLVKVGAAEPEMP